MLITFALEIYYRIHWYWLNSKLCLFVIKLIKIFLKNIFDFNISFKHQKTKKTLLNSLFHYFLIIFVCFIWPSLFIIVCNIFIYNSVSIKYSHLWFLTITLNIPLNIAGYLWHMSVSHTVCYNHSFVSIISRKCDNIIMSITCCSSLNFTSKTMSLSFCICIHNIRFINNFVYLFKLGSVITCNLKFKCLFLFL